jgi:hypothetical protein
MTEPVASDQLRVTVEMGDDYRPRPRLAAALDELAAAVQEEADAEVDGYSLNYEEIEVTYRSFSADLGMGRPGVGTSGVKFEFDGKGNDVAGGSSWKVER